MRKLLSLLWLAFFWLFMLLTLGAFLATILLKLISPHRFYRRAVKAFVAFWGKAVILTTGSRVTITGLELLPREGSLCLIGNHQGLFDIPALIGWLGIPVGFIAKQELFKIPVVSHWMREIPCVFIDRSNARKAIETFQTSADVIRGGHPLVIFPEGTRSRGDQLGEFHLGSFKLPAMAQATMVPFAIYYTCRIYERYKNIRPAHVKIRILPPILPSDPLFQDKRALAETLHQTIQTNVDSL